MSQHRILLWIHALWSFDQLNIEMSLMPWPSELFDSIFARFGATSEASAIHSSGPELRRTAISPTLKHVKVTAHLQWWRRSWCLFYLISCQCQVIWHGCKVVKCWILLGGRKRVCCSWAWEELAQEGQRSAARPSPPVGLKTKDGQEGEGPAWGPVSPPGALTVSSPPPTTQRQETVGLSTCTSPTLVYSQLVEVKVTILEQQVLKEAWRWLSTTSSSTSHSHTPRYTQHFPWLPWWH